MPETPRFLMSVGREEEAFAFLVKYHGNGNSEDALVLYEFEEIKEAIKAEKIAKATSWRELLKSKGNLHRLGLAGLMSFMTGLSGCEWRVGGRRKVCWSLTLSISSFHLLLLL
jgi:SP family sugar:H+ symporter-like MFS transporter